MSHILGMEWNGTVNSDVCPVQDLKKRFGFRPGMVRMWHNTIQYCFFSFSFSFKGQIYWKLFIWGQFSFLQIWYDVEMAKAQGRISLCSKPILKFWTQHPQKPLYQLYFWHLKSMWTFYLVFIFGVVWYRTRDRQPLPLRTCNLVEQKFQVLLKSWSIPIICILKNSTNLRVSTCIMISPSHQTRN